MTEPGTLLELIRQVRAQRQATDVLEGERLRLEGSLVDFVEAAWPYIDAAEYQPNWAIDALCEHLQAVTEGRFPGFWSIFPRVVEKPSSPRSAGLPGRGRDVSGPSEADRRCGF